MKDLLNDSSSLLFYANSLYNGQPIRPAGSQPAGTLTLAAAARARGGIDRPGIQTQPDRHWQSVHWHRSAAHFILQFKVKLTVLGLAVTVTQRQPQAVTV